MRGGGKRRERQRKGDALRRAIRGSRVADAFEFVVLSRRGRDLSQQRSSSRLFLSWNFRGFYSSCHARKVILTRGFNLLRFLMRLETFRQIITSAIHLWFFLRLRKNIFLIRGWTRNTYDLSFTVSLLKSLGRLLAYAIRQIVIIILIHDSSFPRCNVKKPVPFVFLLNIFFNINYVTCYITMVYQRMERWFQQRLE